MSEICDKCDLHLSADSICMKGYGDPQAKVMIIGGSPGLREDEIGKPFQGKVGKVLDGVLRAQKVTRESVFLTNVVRCKPPKSKSPKKKEIVACREWLLAEIERVDPKFILVLGNTAAKGVFDELSKFKMGDIRGRFTERDGRMYFATYHPSVEISGISKYLKIMESDFKRFFEVVKLGKLPEGDELNLTIVNSVEDYEEFLKVLRKEDEIAFDIETTGLVPWEGNIVSLGFGFNDQEFVIPLNHSEGWIDGEHDEQSLLCEEVEKILEGKTLIAHNGKFDTLWTKVQYDMDLSLDHDTMLLSHLLDENTGNGLKYLSETLLGAENYEIPLSAKKGEASLELLSEYNAWDVYYTLRLYKRFKKELKEDPALCKFYEYVTMPAARYFRDIEYQGVYINLEKLDLVEEKYEKKVEALAEELEEIKPGVNWNSPKQVADFLFKDLRLTPLERTKSGGFSTAESVMQRLARKHPAPKKILELRGARKMLSTFVSSWKEKEVESRLHPSFKLHGTVTGRLSCTSPNLQQVPRDPEIRSLVSAPEGWTLIEADFSQVELRIAAILSGDKAMQKAFNEGEDIHTKTAIMVSGINPTGMSKPELKEWRKKAKATNFGFLYGMGAKKFQEYARDKYDINYGIEECKNIRNRFFKSYSGLKPWYERQYRIARMNSGVRGLTGRVRHLPDIHSSDGFLKSQAERQAVNSVVQGFASDLTIMAVIEIMSTFGEGTLNIVGTVHDAILMEIKDERLDDVIPRVKHIMENPSILEEFGVKLPIPIIADVTIGDWGKGEEWVK